MKTDLSEREFFVCCVLDSENGCLYKSALTVICVTYKEPDWVPFVPKCRLCVRGKWLRLRFQTMEWNFICCILSVALSFCRSLPHGTNWNSFQGYQCVWKWKLWNGHHEILSWKAVRYHHPIQTPFAWHTLNTSMYVWNFARRSSQRHK